MFLELVLGAILWVGHDANSNAELRVSCEQVELYYGGKAKATPVPVTFYTEDEEFDIKWTYKIPMVVSHSGTLLLEPTEYWIEEIKRLPKIVFKIGNRNLVFNLKGSKKAINCEGDVAQ